MQNILKITQGLTLLLCLTLGLSAQNVNYPPQDIRFTPEKTKKGDVLLSLEQPLENSGKGKWNTITVRIPGVLNYAPGIVVEGKAMLESKSEPNHLGFILLCTSGKQLFAKAYLKPGEPVDFSIPLSDFKVSDNAKNLGEPNTEDQIQAIRVLASFSPNEVESTFTLETFALLSGGE